MRRGVLTTIQNRLGKIDDVVIAMRQLELLQRGK